MTSVGFINKPIWSGTPQFTAWPQWFPPATLQLVCRLPFMLS